MSVNITVSTKATPFVPLVLSDFIASYWRLQDMNTKVDRLILSFYLQASLSRK